ncbi:MAG: MBL fold metallo-hydrolase [Kiritimatiellae bacterium]|nr:MBL fold metallo-hydrolase [Kiritimatiellia bacterium]
MNLYTLPVGPFEVNCYLACQPDGAALLFDPGADADAILAWIKQKHARVEAILLTHGHMDHLSALADVSRALPVPVYGHPADERWAFGPNNQLPPHYDIPVRPESSWVDVSESVPIHAAGWDLRVIETPGHTPGGVCYYFPTEAVLISGDTLFRNNVGRTDLPGASSRSLAQSLKKLARLPHAVHVYPGHGEPTTIGDEIEHNYFMTMAARDAS